VTDILDGFSESGLQVVDIAGDAEFASRRLHSRNGSMQMEAMSRLALAFVEHPETILQELVNAAVQLCGADSAGISIEREDKTDEVFYKWIATAGVYSSFIDASLPKHPSACTLCLERSAPQHFRVSKRFFDILGVEAELVKDGLLLPWEVDEMRGTIFVISHDRTEAFDSEDLHLMQVLAGFAAMGVRHSRQREALLQKEREVAAAAMANDLAHQINNPLQSLTNILFLAESSGGGRDAKELASQMSKDFQRLCVLVEKLLSLPKP
jgi:GAF domain-containing protein